MTVNQTREALLNAIRQLVPEYLANEADRSKNAGHAAVCVIDETGNTSGAMFGDDRIKLRTVYRTAVSKALQVWLTGIETGEYEKRIYNGEMDYHQYGIPKPEFIGYEGGIPVELKGCSFAVGFSGFRGCSDREIIFRAIEQVLKDR